MIERSAGQVFLKVHGSKRFDSRAAGERKNHDLNIRNHGACRPPCQISWRHGISRSSNGAFERAACRPERTHESPPQGQAHAAGIGRAGEPAQTLDGAPSNDQAQKPTSLGSDSCCPRILLIRERPPSKAGLFHGVKAGFYFWAPAPLDSKQTRKLGFGAFQTDLPRGRRVATTPPWPARR